ncbi:hypothetical protein GPECTOR_1g804 [Gonium pectorale]|uniref:RAP domain-containing protein n=1 Tax=Gonium pectorale TaxID=33097 RepID=A0A150H4B3_GONPE|nr:hypothetical protein GPECTOR_1g804 [Gonium pectorale]|eukprot:KXZ56892.1 hypothetical protein GPECTOR_1g804 [Gonium pectorale]
MESIASLAGIPTLTKARPPASTRLEREASSVSPGADRPPDSRHRRRRPAHDGTAPRPPRSPARRPPVSERPPSLLNSVRGADPATWVALVREYGSRVGGVFAADALFRAAHFVNARGGVHGDLEAGARAAAAAAVAPDMTTLSELAQGLLPAAADAAVEGRLGAVRACRLAWALAKLSADGSEEGGAAGGGGAAPLLPEAVMRHHGRRCAAALAVQLTTAAREAAAGEAASAPAAAPVPDQQGASERRPEAQAGGSTSAPALTSTSYGGGDGGGASLTGRHLVLAMWGLARLAEAGHLRFNAAGAAAGPSSAAAAAALRSGRRELWDALCGGLSANGRLAALSARELSNGLLALALAGHTNHPLFAALTAALEPHLAAAAGAGAAPGAAGVRLVAPVSRCNAQDLANSVWALARARVEPGCRAMRLAEAATLAALPELRARHVVSLLVSFSALRYEPARARLPPPPPALAATGGGAGGGGGQGPAAATGPGPAGGLDLYSALAHRCLELYVLRDEHEGTVAQDLMARAVRAAARHAPAFAPADLATVAWAAASVGRLDGELLEACARVVAAEAEAEEAEVEEAGASGLEPAGAGGDVRDTGSGGGGGGPRPRLSLAALSDVAWAHSALRLCNPGLMAAVADLATRRLEQAAAEAAAGDAEWPDNGAGGLSSFYSDGRGDLGAGVETRGRRTSQPSPVGGAASAASEPPPEVGHVVALLEAFAVWAAAPPATGAADVSGGGPAVLYHDRLFRRAAAVLLRRLDELSSDQLVTLAWSCAAVVHALPPPAHQLDADSAAVGAVGAAHHPVLSLLWAATELLSAVPADDFPRPELLQLAQAAAAARGALRIPAALQERLAGAWQAAPPLYGRRAVVELCAALEERGWADVRINDRCGGEQGAAQAPVPVDVSAVGPPPPRALPRRPEALAATAAGSSGSSAGSCGSAGDAGMRFAFLLAPPQLHAVGSPGVLWGGLGLKARLLRERGWRVVVVPLPAARGGAPGEEGGGGGEGGGWQTARTTREAVVGALEKALALEGL